MSIVLHAEFADLLKKYDHFYDFSLFKECHVDGLTLEGKLFNQLFKNVFSIGVDCELGFLQEYYLDKRSYLTKFATMDRQLLTDYLNICEPTLFANGVEFKKFGTTDELFIYDDHLKFRGHTKIYDGSHNIDELKILFEKQNKHYKYLERIFLENFKKSISLYVFKSYTPLLTGHLSRYQDIKTNNYFLHILDADDNTYSVEFGELIRVSDNVFLSRIDRRNNGVNIKDTSLNCWKMIIYNMFSLLVE